MSQNSTIVNPSWPEAATVINRTKNNVTTEYSVQSFLFDISNLHQSNESTPRSISLHIEITVRPDDTRLGSNMHGYRLGPSLYHSRFKFSFRDTVIRQIPYVLSNIKNVARLQITRGLESQLKASGQYFHLRYAKPTVQHDPTNRLDLYHYTLAETIKNVIPT